MTIRKVTSPHVPESPAPFSQCLVVGDRVFLSGMTAGLPDGTIAGGDDMAAQTRACFDKIAHLLAAAGASMADVLKVVIHTTDIAKRAEIGAVRRQIFREPYPCSTLVEVKALAAPGLLVEVDAEAIIGASRAA